MIDKNLVRSIYSKFSLYPIVKNGPTNIYQTLASPSACELPPWPLRFHLTNLSFPLVPEWHMSVECPVPPWVLYTTTCTSIVNCGHFLLLNYLMLSWLFIQWEGFRKWEEKHFSHRYTVRMSDLWTLCFNFLVTPLHIKFNNHLP